MNPLRFSPLHLLSLALLLQVVLGADPLYHFCSNSKNYTSNGTYETNLNKLMDSLYYSVPPTGFGLDSVGKDPNRVYGLGLCRGDVSSSDCKSCIADANPELRKRCPNDKEAIIWYDYCLLKYSYDDFFGEIDTKYIFYMWNTQNVSDPTTFNSKVRELLNQIATQAYHTSKLYATGELVLGGSEKLYGLVQCTRDLSSASCKKCLDSAISDLPYCCDGKRGGRVVGGSCNFRYELYAFVNS
ncbi:cysteine-rich repeat secretory protein 38-like [Macadamia integrifolia]|uniref:cysteine-rich repeat secretory protein 38-like n=1 Tax=Macadamia integrifolia TaxID=60698 RepID=UPI001C534132|nr:cysteine-rich repeat secretory protein 38-like [Macadamia integrifolia]